MAASSWSDAKHNADLQGARDARKGMCLFISGELNNAVIILLALSLEQMPQHLSRVCSMLSIERVARRNHVIITKQSKLKCLQMGRKKEPQLLILCET